MIAVGVAARAARDGDPGHRVGPQPAGRGRRGRRRRRPDRLHQRHPDRRPDQPGQLRRPAGRRRARVIGVNSAILTLGSAQSGQTGNIGLGFAIPINQANAIGTQLIKRGKATYPVIGANVEDASGGVELDLGRAVADRPPGRAAARRCDHRDRRHAGHRHGGADREHPDPPTRATGRAGLQPGHRRKQARGHPRQQGGLNDDPAAARHQRAGVRAAAGPRRSSCSVPSGCRTWPARRPGWSATSGPWPAAPRSS